MKRNICNFLPKAEFEANNLESAPTFCHRAEFTSDLAVGAALCFISMVWTVALFVLILLQMSRYACYFFCFAFFVRFTTLRLLMIFFSFCFCSDQESMSEDELITKAGYTVCSISICCFHSFLLVCFVRFAFPCSAFFFVFQQFSAKEKPRWNERV